VDSRDSPKISVRFSRRNALHRIERMPFSDPCAFDNLFAQLDHLQSIKRIRQERVAITRKFVQLIAILFALQVLGFFADLRM
jgi:hypothetical protein